MVTDGEVKRARAKAVGGKKDRCRKGKSCSAACISGWKACLVEMSTAVSNAISSAKNKIGGNLISKSLGFVSKSRIFGGPQRKAAKEKYERLVRRLVAEMRQSAQLKDKDKYKLAEDKLIRLQRGAHDRISSWGYRMSVFKIKKGEIWKDEIEERKFGQYRKSRAALYSKIKESALSNDRGRYNRLVTALERLDNKFEKGNPGLGQSRNELWDKMRDAAGRKKGRGEKRGRGQSLEGEALDTERLKDRVREWRRKMNLTDIKLDLYMDHHDATHVLVRDYIGKSSEKIAGLLGLKGKGPSVLEEMFVDVLDSRLSSTGRQKVRFSAKTEMEVGLEVYKSLEISRGLGFADSDRIHRNRRRISNNVVRYFKVMSERPDFDQFINTLYQVREEISDINRI